MQIETFLPCFPGFYESNFEFNDESMVLVDINEKRAEIGLNEIGYEDVKWSYSGYRQNVCKKATNYIEKQLNELGLQCKLTFKELKSPREYNFSSDMIIVDVEVEAEQLRKLFFECPSEAIQWFLEKFNPSSGFAPFDETLKKASIGYWEETNFDNFHDTGLVMEVILEFHPNSEFNMDDFCFSSTHEVEVDIENFMELVP